MEDADWEALFDTQQDSINVDDFLQTDQNDGEEEIISTAQAVKSEDVSHPQPRTVSASSSSDSLGREEKESFTPPPEKQEGQLAGGKINVAAGSRKSAPPPPLSMPTSFPAIEDLQNSSQISSSAKTVQDQELPVSADSDVDPNSSIDPQLERKKAYSHQLQQLYRKKERLYQTIFNRDRERSKHLLRQVTLRYNHVHEINQAQREWRQRAIMTNQPSNSMSKKRPIESGPGGEVFQLIYSGPTRKRLKQNPHCVRILESIWAEEFSHELAEMEECLVPIRIEIEVNSDLPKFRDTFTWNLHDPSISPEAFAWILCEDFKLTHLASTLVPLISRQIYDQLSDFALNAFSVLRKQSLFSALVRMKDSTVISYLKELSHRKPGENTWPQLHEQERIWMLALESLCDKQPELLDQVSQSVPTIKLPMELPGELRIPIRLQVTVANVFLNDRIEWDFLASPSSPSLLTTPEYVAQSICRDVGLGGEFVTAVAHQIREQLTLVSKWIRLTGYHFDGGPILEPEMAEWFLEVLDEAHGDDLQAKRPFGGAIRNHQVATASDSGRWGKGGVDLRDQWTPKLDFLTQFEMERSGKDKDRESNRKRRGTRGRRGVSTGNSQSGNITTPLESELACLSAAEILIRSLGKITKAEGDPFAPSAIANTSTGTTLSSSLLTAEHGSIPDMKEPPKTIRSLIWTQKRPLFAGESLERVNLDWLKKVTFVLDSTSSTATVSVLAAEETTSSAPTGRRKGRLAAQIAQSSITAIANAEMQEELIESNRPNSSTPAAASNSSQSATASSNSFMSQMPVSLPYMRSTMPFGMGMPTKMGIMSMPSAMPMMNFQPSMIGVQSNIHPGIDPNWRCLSCGCQSTQTPVLRKGPAGDKCLCNACGLFFVKNQSLRYGIGLLYREDGNQYKQFLSPEGLQQLDSFKNSAINK